MGNRIRAIREDRDKLIPGEYTQAAVARRLGISANSVRSWELDRARPRKAAAKRLAKVLGVSVEDLGLDSPIAPPVSPPSPANTSTKKDKTMTDDGRPVLVAAIVPHPEAGRREVLMTERRYATQHVWSWPSGHVEPGETPADAILREIAEELIVQNARIVCRLGVVDTHDDVSRYWGRHYRNGYLMYHFQIAIDSPTVGVIDHEELLRTDWLSLDRLHDAVTSLPPDLATAAIEFAGQAVTHATTPTTIREPGH